MLDLDLRDEIADGSGNILDRNFGVDPVLVEKVRQDFGELNAFMAVAEERSFTRAAAKLGTSQSTA